MKTDAAFAETEYRPSAGSRVRIVCLGAAVIDHVYDVAEIPATPQKTIATDYRQRCGGIAATAAVAIAHLGHSSAYWGRVGDDAGADVIIGELAAHGVKAINVRRCAGGKTPTSAVIVDAVGERLLSVFQGRLHADADWLPVDDIAEADGVLVDTRWPEGALRVLRAARERQVPGVLDADVGDPAMLNELLNVASHAIFSIPALQKLTGRSDPEAALRAAAEACPGVVGVTMGDQGCGWIEKGMFRHQPAFQVVALDTTGAGDVFHGAYAVAVARRMSLAEAMRYASAAAAIKIEQGNGWDGMPNEQAVATLLFTDKAMPQTHRQPAKPAMHQQRSHLAGKCGN